jgi:hypothetical protein
VEEFDLDLNGQRHARIEGFYAAPGAAAVPVRCPRAPASAASDSTPLARFAFLVGGTWTSEDTLRLAEAPPFQPTVRYDWSADGHLLRVESWRRGLDGSIRLNNVGFYWWRAETCVVTRVLMFPDGGRIEGDYDEAERPDIATTAFTYHPARGSASRWRSTIERLDENRLKETSSRWDGSAWKTMSVLTFTRTG